MSELVVDAVVVVVVCVVVRMVFVICGVAGTAIAESPAIDVTNGSVCDSVDITWDEVETATYYRVYRNTEDDSATATVIAQPYVGTSFWQDTTAVAGQEYYYWVTAENDCGESPLADDGLLGWTGQLEPPAQVTASDDACDIVTIDWDEVTDAVEYEVFKIGRASCRERV